MLHLVKIKERTITELYVILFFKNYKLHVFHFKPINKCPTEL